MSDTPTDNADRSGRWQERYASGVPLPWDTGAADPHLVTHVQDDDRRGRALDIGCGTGTNVRWLTAQGFDALGVDIAPAAIERARAATAEDVPGAPYDFIYDRGCFHAFDAAAERATFARRVSELLAPGGRWLSLIGSTEGAPRETGPPRRSVVDIAAAVEPFLAVASLTAVDFEVTFDFVPAGWSMLAVKREMPAQPSSRHP